MSGGVGGAESRGFPLSRYKADRSRVNKTGQIDLLTTTFLSGRRPRKRLAHAFEISCGIHHFLHKGLFVLELRKLR